MHPTFFITGATGSLGRELLPRLLAHEPDAQLVLLLRGTDRPEVEARLAELRRFADGAITHAVVWGAHRLGGRAHARDAIVPLIVAHVLARHCGWYCWLTKRRSSDVVGANPIRR